MGNKKKRLILPLIVALALTLWPARVISVEANETARLSPLAVPVRNLWGAPKNESVGLTLTQSDKVVGWSWTREWPLQRPGVNYIQPIYPNARITLSPPVTVNDIEAFQLFAEYNYTRQPEGSYNLAYDVFLREKGPAKDNRKAEIMVWFDWTLEQSAKTFKGTCSDGVNTYKHYSWTRANSFDYHSFLLELPPGKVPGPVNLKALIDIVQPDIKWYISEVELGNEVWSGSGAIELTTYYLELNGTRM
ncbi:MAG: hypothetical protein A2Z29_08390 [Chloroflexi bacterium RBG_16_56_11]|nr:MAG: hypothetical protein A2Z29_08390 [Chloroflexi bacterium RBG_16_56_11]